MAELHGHLSRKRDLELQGRAYEVWVRRILLLLVFGIVVAALLNAFGQRSTTSTVATPAATLTVAAPERLRGGLIFEGRFEIHATTTIRHPRLRLAPGWMEGMTLNTVEPSPAFERTVGRELILGFPKLSAGSDFTVYTQWQVNPVNVGSRSQDVALYNRHRQITEIHRVVRVFP